MASFADFYRPPPFNTAWMLGGLQREEQHALEDYGVGTSRLNRMFTERDLPQLANTQAARGAFHTSATGKMAGQMAEDVGFQTGQMQRQLTRQRESIQRRRQLIPYGHDVGY